MERLPLGVSLGWAIGTIGSSTMLGAMALVVLFYLTEYLGISPATAGALIFASRLWDIGASLLIGQWSDRIDGRFGRRVPFLIAGGPVAAMAYGLLFAAPESLTGGAVTTYAFVALLLYATGYSLFVVPYLAVPAEITTDPKNRTSMMAYRVVFMTLAGINVAVLGPVLLRAFGGGRVGYAAAGWVQAGVILASLWLCAAIVARAPIVSRATASNDGAMAQIGQVLKNRPFVVFIGVKFCQLTAAASTTAAMLYVARYILGQGEDFLIRFGAFQVIGTLAAVPAWSFLARRIGKRDAYMAAGYTYAAIALTWLTTALGEPQWVTDIRVLLIGASSAGLLVIGFSILPDTMAHNTKLRGVAQEGTMAAIYSMVEKGTAAVGPLIAGVVLEISGFVSAAGGELPPAQPPSAIAAILALAAVIPAAFNIIGSLWLRKYHLSEKEL